MSSVFPLSSSAMTSPLHPWKTDEQDELIELGNNWWVLARFGAPVS